MNENLISVIDAAKKLGIRKQQLFRIIKRLGVATTREKSSAHKAKKQRSVGRSLYLTFPV